MRARAAHFLAFDLAAHDPALAVLDALDPAGRGAAFLDIADRLSLDRLDLARLVLRGVRDLFLGDMHRAACKQGSSRCGCG
jgi:hypothetical protein